MAFFLHGIKLPHKKNTAKCVAVKMNPPATVTILMQMHIGSPALPIVKVGDKVNVGTLIAGATKNISANIHSSVSGTVKKIEDVVISNGQACKSIVIESDGEMTPDPEIKPPHIDSKESLVEAIANAGIVGLGGAGFPTSVKYDVDETKIEELVINGAECEPYITSDTRTMIDRADDMQTAIECIKKHFRIKKIIIGVEKNNPESIRKMKELSEADPCIKVKVLPSVYPQGGEKVLVYHTTGKVVPIGKFPIDVGCIVSNCTTIADIGRYIKTGMPLVEKCVTVDGSAIKTPMNVLVPIGTKISDVFDFAGGFKSEPYKVIYGGPMMGISVPSMDAPILKNTNAVLAFNKKDSVLTKSQPCIKCGNCINACPFGINPPELARALAEHNVDNMIKFGGEACMECGCCAFVCSANRPLIQNHRLIKAEIRKAKENKNKEENK